MQVVLEETGVIISTVQASRLKEYGKSDELTLPMVAAILTEPKPIGAKSNHQGRQRSADIFQKIYSNEQIENVIYQLLDGSGIVQTVREISKGGHEKVGREYKI